MGRKKAVVVTVVKVIVDEQDRPVIPAEGAPADVVVVPPPVNPGRAPVMPGDPVPAQPEAPMPAAIVVDRPAPGLRGYPGPADDGVPDPAAVEVRPPVDVGNPGDPDVPVAALIDPLAVLVELLFILLDLGREILASAARGEERVPRAVPSVEPVLAAVGVLRIAEKPAVGGGHGLVRLDEDGAVLGGRLETAFPDGGLGFPVEPDVEPVETLFENVERGVGSMDLDALVHGEPAHPEISAAFGEMELDALVPLGGQDGEFDPGVVVKAKVVPVSEVDLGLAAVGPHLVPLDQREVDLALLVAQVRGPLDVDRAGDIAQAGEAVRIIPFILRLEAERHKNDESGRQERSLCHHLVHRLSPSDPLLSNYRASLITRGEWLSCPLPGTAREGGNKTRTFPGVHKDPSVK
jgi:hypothetical protein